MALACGAMALDFGSGHKDQPPDPRDPSEARRVQHTRLRRRILYCEFEDDLKRLVVRMVGPERAKAWGQVDMTGNPYATMWKQASRLYAVAPKVTAPPGGEELLAILKAKGYWSQMQRTQRDTLALQEMVLRIDVIEGELVLRWVFPDHATGQVTSRDPSEPVAMSDWCAVDGEWVQDVADVSGDPYLTTLDSKGKEIGPRLAGDAYPFVSADDVAVLPYVMYHTTDTGRLWDPYTDRELVSGSLNLGVYLTMFGHSVLNASWPQRYTVGAEIEGADLDTGNGVTVRGLVLDAAKLATFRSQEGVTAQIGQFDAGCDPEALFRALSLYERRLLLSAGLHPPDVTRQQADVRSGYSLAVAREAVREQQRLSEPSFRRADMAAIRLAAIALNSATGSSYPEVGYEIDYRGLPPSPVEDAAKLQVVTDMLDRGVISADEARVALADVLGRLDIDARAPAPVPAAIPAQIQTRGEA